MTGARVMVVDDNRDSLVICEAQLTHAGYTVTPINDGTQACASAVLHRPDVILLDFRLPGTSGHEVAAGLYADPRCSSIPVIVLTADIEARKAAFPPNVRGVLLKPCESSALIEAVSAAVGDSLLT